VTVSYPYALTEFADVLPIANVRWDIQRNDEMSGAGDGSVWQAELSSPLWIATVALTTMKNGLAKQVAAKIRKLHGAQEAFRLYDPSSLLPQLDPRGSIIGDRAVEVASISGDRASVSFAGFPAGYRLLPGDKFSFSYGSNPTRVGFFEISEAVVASSGGTTGNVSVFPHLPSGVSAGVVVRIKYPYCEMKILPGSHDPGSSDLLFTTGAGFKAIQKR
jgi:hypothetical protein